MNSVSYIIRTLNEGKTIGRVLDEISRQTHKFYEIIVVDSGSQDETLSIAEDYGCKIVCISPSEWSWGRSLNLGISHAIGEYICVISGHCYLENFDTVRQGLVLLRDTDILYGAQLPVDNMDPFEEWELYNWYPKLTLLDNHKRILIGKGVGVSNACVLFKKKVWLAVKFNESLQSMEDAEWAFRCSKENFKIFYSDAFSVFHSHPINIDYIYRKWFFRQYEGYNFLNKTLGLYSTSFIGTMRFYISSMCRFFKLPIDAFRLKLFLSKKYNVLFRQCLGYFFIRNMAIHNAYLYYRRNIALSYWEVSSTNIDKITKMFFLDKLMNNGI